MSAFRLLDPFEVFLGDDAKPLAGGRFDFTDAGTTDPRDVFGDRALTVNNGASVGIDSTGRAVHPVWGSGAYRVRLYDAAGVLQAEADWIEIPGGEGATIPALVDGSFLTNNGSVLQWGAVRQLPDPTGQDGKMLVADGAGYTLVPQPTAPEIPDPDIVIGAMSFLAGVSDSSSKFFVQAGTDTAPASGANTTSKATTFETPFAQLWIVLVCPTVNRAGATGWLPAWSVPVQGANGFTVNFDTNADRAGGAIVNPLTYRYLAIGTRNVS